MRELDDIFFQPILEGVADFMGITVDQISEKGRRQETVMARMLAVYVLLYLGFSSLMSGNIIGRDHSTIIHYKKLFAYDRLFQDKLRGFKAFMSKRDLGDSACPCCGEVKGVVIPDYAVWRDRLEARGQFHKEIGLKKK